MQVNICNICYTVLYHFIIFLHYFCNPIGVCSSVYVCLGRILMTVYHKVHMIQSLILSNDFTIWCLVSHLAKEALWYCVCGVKLFWPRVSGISPDVVQFPEVCFQDKCKVCLLMVEDSHNVLNKVFVDTKYLFKTEKFIQSTISTDRR